MSEATEILKIVCPACQQKLDVTGLASFTRIECPSCQGALIVPRPFGDLLLEEPLGGGALATVYRALDLTLDREVAVKILNEDIARQPSRVALFLDEARRAAAVNHPNVVPIYSCGEVDDQPYLVMQFMAGLSLAHQLERYPSGLPLGECYNAVAQAARGLEAAHRCDIVHHDVAPANILIDEDKNVRVADFGLARVAWGGQPQSVDDLVTYWQTPYYVSSERVTNGEEDYRGDIYSLGATLYHLMTGRPPFAGATPSDIARARTAGTSPPAPVSLRPEIGEAASEFVLRMLHVQPAERPRSYGIVISALDKFRKELSRGAGITKPPLSRQPPRMAKPPGAVVPPPRVRPGASHRTKSRSQTRLDALINTGLAISVLILVLLLLAMAAKRRQGGDSRGGAGSSGRVGLPSTSGGSAAGGRGASATGGASQIPEQFRGRPRPADLDFLAVRDGLQAYLGGLPEPLREVENERIRYVTQCRGYLIQLMKYLPFDDGTNTVRLRDGTVLSGSVPYCNEHQIMVRLSGSGAGLRKLRWEEVSFEQFVGFFRYYIKARLDQGDSAVKERPGAHLAEAADDCFRLALLCDWYGYGDQAREFGQQACEYSPRLAPSVERLIAGVRQE